VKILLHRLQALGRIKAMRSAVGASLIVLALVATAAAGSVLERVKRETIIRCGGAARPGLLDISRGEARGVLVDICRAVGTAAAGPSVKVELAIYDADATYDRVRRGSDDVFFLSGSQIIAQKLERYILPGPAAFVEATAVMVAANAAFVRPTDLAGEPVCFLQGDVSHRQLEAYFAERHLAFIRMGFQEEAELYDAFDAQHCHAVAAPMTTLAYWRRGGGKTLSSGRILAEPLAAFPIVLATGTGDGEWSALVAWTMATLLNADRVRKDWAAGGLDSLPLEPAELAVPAGWQKAIITTTGSYAEIIRRHIGEGSAFGLPFRLNGLVDHGGLMMPLYAE
jgi:general L-amino acid transport system substrate-binding protein